jgi:hypothetical protein
MPELVGLVFQGEPVIFRHYVALLVEGLEDHEVGAAAVRTRLGDLERAEAAREGKLRFIGDVLVAKDQNRVLLERRAHRRVCSLACRNVVDGHSAQFRGKARTQRHDFHRRPPSHSGFEHDFPAKTSRRQASRLARARRLEASSSFEVGALGLLLVAASGCGGSFVVVLGTVMGAAMLREARVSEVRYRAVPGIVDGAVIPPGCCRHHTEQLEH